MNNNPLISVIVPVYNVEKYLDRCIQSIVDQTYKDIEIILVDDGSPDNCPKKTPARLPLSVYVQRYLQYGKYARWNRLSF